MVKERGMSCTALHNQTIIIIIVWCGVVCCVAQCENAVSVVRL